MLVLSSLREEDGVHVVVLSVEEYVEQEINIELGLDDIEL